MVGFRVKLEAEDVYVYGLEMVEVFNKPLSGNFDSRCQRLLCFALARQEPPGPCIVGGGSAPLQVAAASLSSHSSPILLRSLHYGR